MPEFRVEALEAQYPEFALSLRNLVIFERKVHDWMVERYGSNSIDYLVAFNDFNKLSYESNVNDTTEQVNPRIAKFAQKRKRLFNMYIDASKSVYQREGFATTSLYSDFLKSYYQQIAYLLA
ncbi:MAG: hypothetical protein EBU90_07985 [Proteobacteria bacterium]|nr:hypothetical protein [Pseudomonadota bacterium]NBP15098.1 hypothetical protein [bacterium]